MDTQELNIKMNEDKIRNLILGYIKDSHHDLFTSNTVFRDIWLRIKDGSSSIRNDEPPGKRARSRGQMGGRERDDDKPFNQKNV